MATCKECLHYDACSTIYQIVFYKNPPITGPDAERCRCFKDRTKWVEQKHGRWIKQKRSSSWDCSICGYTTGAYIAGCANHCPNCGAKMDGKDGNE